MSSNLVNSSHIPSLKAIEAWALEIRHKLCESEHVYIPSNLTCTAQNHDGGSYNEVQILNFSDGEKWVFKLDKAANTTKWNSERQIHMAYVAEIQTTLSYNTSLPVPQVYHCDTGHNNTLKCPHIFMQYMPGEPLQTVIDREQFSPERRTEILIRAYRDLAKYVAELQRSEFNGMGAPILNGQYRGHTTCYFSSKEESTRNFTGLEDFFQHRLQEIRERHNKSPELIWLHLFLKWASEALQKSCSYLSYKFSLYHPDLHDGNILCDQHGGITGLIDWDFLQTGPKCISALSFPRIAARDWYRIPGGPNQPATRCNSIQGREYPEAYEPEDFLQSSSHAEHDFRRILWRVCLNHYFSESFIKPDPCQWTHLGMEQIPQKIYEIEREELPGQNSISFLQLKDAMDGEFTGKPESFANHLLRRIVLMDCEQIAQSSVPQEYRLGMFLGFNDILDATKHDKLNENLLQRVKLHFWRLLYTPSLPEPQMENVSVDLDIRQDAKLAYDLWVLGNSENVKDQLDCMEYIEVMKHRQTNEPRDETYAQAGDSKTKSDSLLELLSKDSADVIIADEAATSINENIQEHGKSSISTYDTVCASIGDQETFVTETLEKVVGGKSSYSAHADPIQNLFQGLLISALGRLRNDQTVQKSVLRGAYGSESSHSEESIPSDKPESLLLSDQPGETGSPVTVYGSELSETSKSLELEVEDVKSEACQLVMPLNKELFDIKITNILKHKTFSEENNNRMHVKSQTEHSLDNDYGHEGSNLPVLATKCLTENGDEHHHQWTKEGGRHNQLPFFKTYDPEQVRKKNGAPKAGSVLDHLRVNPGHLWDKLPHGRIPGHDNPEQEKSVAQVVELDNDHNEADTQEPSLHTVEFQAKLSETNQTAEQTGEQAAYLDGEEASYKLQLDDKEPEHTETMEDTSASCADHLALSGKVFEKECMTEPFNPTQTEMMVQKGLQKLELGTSTTSQSVIEEVVTLQQDHIRREPEGEKGIEDSFDDDVFEDALEVQHEQCALSYNEIHRHGDIASTSERNPEPGHASHVIPVSHQYDGVAMSSSPAINEVEEAASSSEEFLLQVNKNRRIVLLKTTAVAEKYAKWKSSNPGRKSANFVHECDLASGDLTTKLMPSTEWISFENRESVREFIEREKTLHEGTIDDSSRSNDGYESYFKKPSLQEIVDDLHGNDGSSFSAFLASLGFLEMDDVYEELCEEQRERARHKKASDDEKSWWGQMLKWLVPAGLF